MPNQDDNRVLVIGVYLLDTPNHAPAISEALTGSENWKVDVRWAAVGCGEVPEGLQTLTVSTTESRIPKFRLLNALIKPVDLKRYRYLVVTDDDIELGDRFLDHYLYLQTRYDFALAQPARTHDSYVDHQFVAQLLGVEARLTRFVEIGPLFSIQSEAYPFLLPFNENAPMGWGLDFVWPTQVEREGYRMGIIDATPVKHALRKPVALYDYDETNDEMQRFLDANTHLSPGDAFVALETYPISEASF